MKNWKRKLILVIWCLLGTATFVLLGAAMYHKDNQLCTDVVIEIQGGEQHLFIDEKAILNYLSQVCQLQSNKMQNIPLRKLEELLEKNAWIYKAELFFDNKGVLHINITEREPLARVFTAQGTSFYLDSSGLRLPLSDKLSANVPFFTSFPSDNPVLSKPDSLVLNDVKQIAKAIVADSFWKAQTAQINITGQRTYELIPLIGNQIIDLGTADSMQTKLSNLFAFYKNVWSKAGFEKYEKINVQYNGQIVATRKNAANVVVDSVKAISILNSTAGIVSSDSSYVNGGIGAVKENTVKPVAKPAVTTQNIDKKQQDVKTAEKKENNKQQPKAVMPKAATNKN